MELLLAIAITGIIFVPLMAWTGLALRQQPVTRDGLLRTASTGLLASSFPRDVTIAGKAGVSGQGLDEAWAGDCGAGRADHGSVQLVMVTGGTDVQKIVYTVADLNDDGTRDPTQKSVWRRTCGVGADNQVRTEQQLFEGVKLGSTTVTCPNPTPGDARCRQIELRTTPADDDKEILFRATRRLDEASIPTDVLGNPIPTAKIQLVSRAGTEPMTAAFSAGGSTVGAGRSIASYRWEFEATKGVTSSSTTTADVTATFPSADSYTVLLTVTDDKGSSNTTYFQISSSNALPVAVVGPVSPDPATMGSTVALSSAGSYDPDGVIIAFDWLLTLPSPDGASPGVQVRLSGPNPSYAAPSGVTGLVSITLAVRDGQLGQSTTFGSFTLIDPATTTTTTTTVVGETTTTVPGQLVAAFADSGPANDPVRDFDASSTAGIAAGASATYEWDFGVAGASGSGQIVSHTYPGSGQYNVTLTVTSEGRTAQTSRFVSVGSAPNVPTDVRPEGSSVVWTAVAGVRRYLVDFEFRTSTDCYQLIGGQAVGAVPNPSKAIPTNPCPPSAVTRARVGADANGVVSWSDWVVVPTLNGGQPTPAPPSTSPVVK